MTSAQKDQLTEAITGTFMWSFKKGDNIVYNLEIAQELYRARATSADKSKYNKPLLITLVSVIECILDDCQPPQILNTQFLLNHVFRAAIRGSQRKLLGSCVSLYEYACGCSST